MYQNKKQIIELIEQFRHKAGCHHTLVKAEYLRKQLKLVLSSEEFEKLDIAFSHYQLGEGSEELYSVCKELVTSYKIV